MKSGDLVEINMRYYNDRTPLGLIIGVQNGTGLYNRVWLLDEKGMEIQRYSESLLKVVSRK